MEVLKEILRIVTSKSDVAKVLPELELSSGDDVDSLTGRFLRGLLNDEFGTDEEAAKVLYNAGRSDQRYRTLKSRTYERLLHSILFLQVKQPEHSEYLSYYYKCTRNLICAQTLMRFASRTAGFEVAEKTLTIAEKYQFTDICLTLCKLLCETSAITGMRKKFDLYQSKMNLYFEILQAEYKSDALLDLHVLECNVYSRTIQYLQSLAETTWDEVVELKKKFNSHNLILNEFRMRITVYEGRDDIEGLLETCNEAIKYLEANPHLSQPARLGEFRLRKMMILLMTQRVAEAYSIADYVASSFRSGGNNWYLAQYFATIASLRVGEYALAESYINKATTHRMYILQDESRKETFTILSAYMLIAEQLGLREKGIDQLEINSNYKSKFRHFRLSTYLNSVPEESKKKKITNVVILISHVCFLLLNEDFDAAERRIDYLRVYISRYLREQAFNRVRLFLRLLQTFPKHSFDPARIRKANTQLFQQLQDTAEDTSPAMLCEYIQFETLYHGLLGHLERYEASIEA